MPDLPAGTVTFLFTDIEHSTLLLQELGDRWPDVLEDQRRLIRTAIRASHGREIGTEGDSFFVVFSSALDAATAVVAAQRELTTHCWPGSGLRVRMGLHTGEARVVGDGYVGLDVHRAARIAAAGHGGQVLLSEATVSLVEKQLPPDVSVRDLGEHRLKDLPTPEHVSQLDIQGLPTEFPALKSLDVRRNNLPLQLTSFIGRAEELADVRRLMGKARLVTLLGAGGIGKTRLALQLATEVLEEYADGVWLTELAPLSDPQLVTAALLNVLGLREQPGRSAQQSLIEYLSSRQVLLLLDNCEHLVETTARLVAALLQACPKLRVLATSREALGVSGEVVWRVPSLSLPDPEGMPPVAELADWPAVMLFVERGIAAQPSFQLSPSTAPVIVQICRRLDGIPLAIELAAARLKVLSITQLATRLNDRFRLLTGGNRAALPRQQTLRATIDWSYDLLAEPEKVFLRRLAVFAGAFSLEAAEAVCAWDPISADEVLDLVTALTSKSLLMPSESEAEARYGLLETIREYAAARVREAGELAQLERAQREWFLAQAELAEGELRGPDQFLWFDRLDTELDNLRAGFKSCLENGEAEAALRYAAALGVFWRARGRFTEGRDWLRRALDAGRSAEPRVRGSALAWAGYLAAYQGVFAEAARLTEQSLALYREAADTRGIGFALQVLGAVALNQDDYPRAVALVQESLPFLREADDLSGLGFSHLYLAVSALQKAEYSSAMDTLQEAVGLLRRAGDKRGIAIALRIMGDVELSQGHYEPASALLQESLDLAREAKDKAEQLAILHLLGRAARCQGHYPQASELFELAFRLAGETNQRLGLGVSQIELGTVARLEGDPARATGLILDGLGALDPGHKAAIASGLHSLAITFCTQSRCQEAAKLLGAAEALSDEIGAHQRLFESREREEGRELLGSRLGTEELDRHVAAGRLLGVQDALAFARQTAAGAADRLPALVS